MIEQPWAPLSLALSPSLSPPENPECDDGVRQGNQTKTGSGLGNQRTELIIALRNPPPLRQMQPVRPRLVLYSSLSLRCSSCRCSATSGPQHACGRCFGEKHAVDGARLAGSTTRTPSRLSAVHLASKQSTSTPLGLPLHANSLNRSADNDPLGVLVQQPQPWPRSHPPRPRHDPARAGAGRGGKAAPAAPDTVLSQRGHIRLAARGEPDGQGAQVQYRPAGPPRRPQQL